MNPQPPVTRMRMAARTSSAERSALAESAPATAGIGSYVEQWKVRFAGIDWVPWLIIALAAFLRFFLLGIKPPHFDEGINGWFVDQVMKNGFYRYDPTNYHGPLHFYVLLLFQSLFGRNVWALRLPIVLVSIGCVWLALKFEPLVGSKVSRIAALAMAVSPGFVFYGRYAIHEVWLQFFSMMFILGLLGLWRRGTLTYLWYAGAGLTGMILTKETYAIHVACALLAIPTLAVSYALNRGPDAKPAKQTRSWIDLLKNEWDKVKEAIKPAKRSWSYIDLAMVLIVGAAAVIFFYSGTFFNWSGVKGLYLAFKAWTETGAAGHGHEKTWDYWLKLMGPSWGTETDKGCYELPMLAGLILCVFCQRFKNLSLRFLAIYGVGSLVAYSYVKYKTPWCIVSFGWPFLFIFGAAVVLTPFKFSWKEAWVLIALSVLVILASALWQHTDPLLVALMIITAPIVILAGLVVLSVLLNHPRAVHVAIIVLLSISLGRSVWLNYFRCSSPDERYAYVQTYNDMFKLTKPLLTMAKRDPSNYHLIGHLIRSSVYPLPWVLGDFDRVGYYEGGNMPPNLDGDFLLVQEDKIKDVESKLKGTYYTEMMTLRNYQEPSKIFFSANVFKDLFPGRKPEFVGSAQKPSPTPAPPKAQ
jgi:uncharacterized protein (TIGR03663 family)